MPYTYLEKADNVYTIDTNMFDFKHYNSAYIIQGEEIALIDTGLPAQIEAVRAGIKAHGFSTSDISRIFVTHCEHPDHSGNVAVFLKDSPQATVYINPLGLEYLTDPSIEDAKRREVLPSEMAARFGGMEPVPLSRINCVHDDDEIDLGNGDILRVIFTPGHQPSCMALYNQRNQGLFISDTVGNYLADIELNVILTPPRSDIVQTMESLKKLMDLQVDTLYLGHYGIICENPKQVMSEALSKMQQVTDIGTKYVREGKPEIIADKLFEMYMPELERMRSVRGNVIYQYAIQEHLYSMFQAFTKYCMERFH
jgi:glyoxylase-like metal-dependent hydrolase (beta-lactamase superfamily II)